MENNSLFIFGGIGSVIVGGICILAVAVAITYAVTRLNTHADQLQKLSERVQELEKISALKPNSRAAMERRDAYEDALFSVVKAQEEVETARTRLDALTNLLSKKA